MVQLASCFSSYKWPYYPLQLWGFSGIIKQMIEMEHNIFKNPTQLVGDKPVGYFTSVVEHLNSKLPKTNPGSGQSRVVQSWFKITQG